MVVDPTTLMSGRGKGLGRFHRHCPPLPREHYEVYFKNKWYTQWVEHDWETIRMEEIHDSNYTFDEVEDRSFHDYKETYPYFKKLMNAAEIAEVEWTSITGDFENPSLSDEVEYIWQDYFNCRHDNGPDYDQLDSFWNELWAEISRIIREENSDEDD